MYRAAAGFDLVAAEKRYSVTIAPLGSHRGQEARVNHLHRQRLEKVVERICEQIPQAAIEVKLATVIKLLRKTAPNIRVHSIALWTC